MLHRRTGGLTRLDVPNSCGLISTPTDDSTAVIAEIRAENAAVMLKGNCLPPIRHSMPEPSSSVIAPCENPGVVLTELRTIYPILMLQDRAILLSRVHVPESCSFIVAPSHDLRFLR